MAFKKITSNRLSDKIVHDIVEQIQCGDLSPGDRLPNEPVLAEMLGVSRGILREALTILQSQGYISRKPKDGTYINELPRRDAASDLFRKASYIELLEMRECLEMRVVERVIARATDEEIEEIFEMITKAETAYNQDGNQGMDFYFHTKLVELSGNALVLNFINMYYDMIEEIAEHSSKSGTRQQQVIAEHTAIAQAIQARDVAAAQTAVKTHFTNAASAVSAHQEQVDCQ